MKNKFKFILATGATLTVSYSAVRYGLVSTALMIGVISTIWFGALAAFSRKPQEPLPFFAAYAKRVYAAAYVALLFSVVFLICTGNGLFFVINALAASMLAMQWWVPVNRQRVEQQRQQRRNSL